MKTRNPAWEVYQKSL